MMPVDNTYGPWPASGELDVFELVSPSVRLKTFQHITACVESCSVRSALPILPFSSHAVL